MGYWPPLPRAHLAECISMNSWPRRRGVARRVLRISTYSTVFG